MSLTNPESRDALADSFGRRARKLRISVTDRCNFRCNFCMPEHPEWMPSSDLLSFDEMARVTGVLASMGVSSVRVSGGEPLLRPGVEKLVGTIATTPGIKTVSLTTNGALLREKARVLKQSGLHCVTVSIHSLKPERYDEITGTRGMFERVMGGLEEARQVGFARVKVNCVITRGCNEDEILDFVSLAHDAGVSMRFIEYMPFDGAHMWDPERVVSGDEIIKRVETRYALEPLEREHGATARYYRFRDRSDGEVGIISSMTRPFCSDCDRIRLKADGKMVPCLFSSDEYDLRPLIRSSASNEDLADFIRRSFWLKSEGVEKLMKDHVALRRVRPMHTIGG